MARARMYVEVLERRLNGEPIGLDELLARMEPGDRISLLLGAPFGTWRCEAVVVPCGRACGNPFCEEVRLEVMSHG